MRKLMTLLSALALALSFAAYAMAQEPAAKPANPHGGKMPSGVVMGDTVTMTATVDMIDLKNRIVTLRGEDGFAEDYVIGPAAQNLAQVKAGDKVVVKYVEALAWEVKKPSTATPGLTITEAVEGAKPGEKPAAVGARQTTVTATIEAIDLAKHTVTLKGPKGNEFRVKAKDPKKLEAVKAGDQVVITYTQAVAIAVEPGPKK